MALVDKPCIGMARVFAYDKKGRKYVKDTKMGRRWRVKGLGKRVKKTEEDSSSQAPELKVEKRKEKRSWPGTVALWEIRKFKKTWAS